MTKMMTMLINTRNDADNGDEADDGEYAVDEYEDECNVVDGNVDVDVDVDVDVALDDTYDDDDEPDGVK